MSGIARRFASLGAGEVIARAAAFGTIFLLTRRLGAAGFGAVAFATAVTLYGSRIADAGMELGVGVREVSAHRHQLDALVPTILGTRLLLASGLVALAMLAWLVWPSTDTHVIALYSLTMLPLAANTRWVLVGLERARGATIARSAGELFAFAAVFTLVRAPEDLLLAPLAQLSGDCVGAAIAMAETAAAGVRIRLRWDGAVLRRLWGRMCFYVAGTLLGLLIYNADLFFLRVYRDPVSVGLYAVAYTPVSLLINLSVTYSMTLLPAMARLNDDPIAQHSLYDTVVAQLSLVVVPVLVGGVLTAPALIRSVFGVEFDATGPIVRVLILLVPLFALRDVLFAMLLAHAREDAVFAQAWQAALLHLPLLWILVPRFGMLGAAVATILTESVRLFLCVRSAQRVGFTWPSMRRVTRPVTAALLMGLAILSLPTMPLWLLLPSAGAVYGVSLVALGVMRVTRQGRSHLHL